MSMEDVLALGPEMLKKTTLKMLIIEIKAQISEGQMIK